MEICTIFTSILMLARLVLRIRNQRKIPRFVISFLIKFKKVLLVIIARYENFEVKRAKIGSKNQKMCLRFQFCTLERVCVLHFLNKSQNSLYPITQYCRVAQAPLYILINPTPISDMDFSCLEISQLVRHNTLVRNFGISYRETPHKSQLVSTQHSS
jgi:hypothetical protein